MSSAPLSPAAMALLARRAAHPGAADSSQRREAPLSYPQLTQWFFAHLFPESTVFNLPKILDLRGAVEEDAVRTALTRIVERHAALRTTFRLVGDDPRQEVREPRAVDLTVHDLRSSDPTRVAGDADALLEREAARPFDLAHDQLLRAVLLRLDETSWQLQVTFHHIAFDGWSTDIFLEEFAAQYSAAVAGGAATLPPLADQVPDFAEWQRIRGTQAEFARDLRYWRERLHGVRSPDLPLDWPASPLPRHRGARLEREIPQELWRGILGFARESGCTPFAITGAAWAVQTGRRCNQEQSLLGVTTAGRSRAEWEPLIGNFVNVVPLLVDLGVADSFRSLVGQLRQRMAESLAHQEVPFQQLGSDVVPSRRSGIDTMFPVVFNFRNFPLRLPKGLPGVTVTAFRAPTRGTVAPISLDVDPGDDRASLRLDFDPDLFDSGTAQRWLDGYLTTLEGALAEPDGPLSRLPVLGKAEVALLAQWNGRTDPTAGSSTLHDGFAAQVAATPDLVAVRTADAEWSYRELDAEARRIAATLRARGIGPGQRVAVWMDRSLGLVASVIGICEAGATYLPIDTSQPMARVAGMLEDAEVSLVLTGPGTPTMPEEWPWPRQAWDAGGGETIEVASAVVTPRDAAYMIFTSGTTGRPKGVTIRHEGAVNHFHAVHRLVNLAPGDAVIQLASISFDLSVWEVWAPLLTGATLVLPPPGQQQDPPALIATLREQKITMLPVVPSMLRALLETGQLSTVTSLRLVGCGGEAMTWDLIRDFRAQQSAVLANHYGPTETSIDASFWVVDRSEGNGPVPIGAPIPNDQVHVLDPMGRIVPIGTPGELHIGGMGVGLGYVNRPDLTAERFIPDPYRPGHTMYRTGDLGRWRHDGLLEYLGRIDHQVKLRGYRIELDEIDTVLRTHPAVGECITIVRNDPPSGDRLVSYLVAKAGARIDPPALRRHLMLTIPEYMVPARFVELPALPLTVNGKLDRHALPRPDDLEAATVDEAPIGALETTIAASWQEVLPTPGLGRHTSFLDVGGHSLLAVRLLAALHRRTGRSVSLAQFLRRPTIANVAGLLEQPATEERHAIAMQPRRRGRTG